MSDSDLRTWAVALATIGGVLIVLGGLAMLLMAPMMGMMMGTTFSLLPMLLVSAWGLATGGVVLLAAYRFRAEPHEMRSWSITALVAGALSLFAMGGFILGAALAITGGILGLFAGIQARAPPAGPPPA